MKTKSKEKPILFAARFIPGLLDGTKTQTRRPVKPQPPSHQNEVQFPAIEVVSHEPLVRVDRPDACRFWHYFGDGTTSSGLTVSPYQVGDVLWCRETFTYWERNEPTKLKPGESTSLDKPQGLARYAERMEHQGEDYLVYKADGAKRSLGEWEYPHPIYEHCVGRFGKTMSPQVMPKWAARLFLEVTAVRVERVSEISEEDAAAEGCPGLRHAPEVGGFLDTPELEFRRLWSKTYPKQPWESTWVWVYEFKRTEILT